MSIGLFLLTLCQRETSINGFQPPERLNYVQKSIPTGTSLWATSKNTNGHNDGDEPSTPKEPANLNLRKRRRRKDYPSFSYNVKTLSSKRKRAKIKKSMEDKIMMKYKGSGFEDVEFRKPPTVSIPDSNTAGTTLTDAVVLNFFGGFESGLGDIGTSAMRSRLRKNRSYARPQQFAIANITVPPSLSDLSYPPSSQIKGFWAGLSARILTGVIAYFVFPYGIIFLDTFVTMQPEDLDQITSKFGPGVSILYGTFVSLTLSILYNRVKNVQDAVARETAILNLVTRNLLSIFKNDRELAVEAAQCCADQVRTLVRSSRGAELMFIMYSDPYARILECLQNKEEQLYEEKGNFGSQGVSWD